MHQMDPKPEYVMYVVKSRLPFCQDCLINFQDGLCKNVLLVPKVENPKENVSFVAKLKPKNYPQQDMSLVFGAIIRIILLFRIVENAE